MILRIFLILAGCLVQGGAWADTTSSPIHAFTPQPGDASVEALSQIFGPAIDGLKTASTDQGQTVVGAMMGIYCLAALFVAMVFVAYTTYRGTLDSAADGRLLGDKMGSIWVPVRTVAGSALLLPLPSGFCLLQLWVMWFALQGAGLASTMWNTALDKLAANGQLGYVSIPDARPLAVAILRSEVCQAVMNKQYADTKRDSRIEFVAESIPVAMGGAPDVNSQQYVTESYIDKSYSWVATDKKLNRDVCGSIHFSDSPTGKDMSSSLRSPLLSAHSQAIRAMIDELQPAAELVASWQPLKVGVLDAAVNHYRTTMQGAAQKAIQATPDAARAAFIHSAKDAGWTAAGAWWASMTRMNDAIQGAVNALPTPQAATIEQYELSDTLFNYQNAMMVLDEYEKDRTGAARADALAAGDFKNVRSADDIWKVLSRPAVFALDSLTHRIAGANTSPVAQLRVIGNDIVGVGTVIKGTMFMAAGVLGARDVDWTLGNVFNLADALKTISGTVEWLSSSLWAMGVVLAYYLPAVPVIAWVTGVIRWLAGVAEAVLAAPLMAASMVHPEGHEIAGKSGAGWMLILSMILQPALLVLGLIIGILMTYPAGALVNSMFLQMVVGATGNDGLGLVGIVAWTAIYVLLMTLAVHSCFALISAVPDGVMRYIAAQVGATNVVKTADDATQRFEGGASGAGGGLGRGGLPNADRGQNERAGGSGGAAENGFTHSNRDLLGG